VCLCQNLPTLYQYLDKTLRVHFMDRELKGGAELARCQHETFDFLAGIGGLVPQAG
jgi:hypothetical protein